MADQGDISNRFLAVEIWVPFAVLAVGGLISWGSLSSDMKHKAEDSDVLVVQAEMKHIKDDVKEIKAEQQQQRKILEEIARNVSKGDD